MSSTVSAQYPFAGTAAGTHSISVLLCDATTGSDGRRHGSDQPLTLMLDDRSAGEPMPPTRKLIVIALDELGRHGATVQISPSRINTYVYVFIAWGAAKTGLFAGELNETVRGRLTSGNAHVYVPTSGLEISAFLHRPAPSLRACLCEERALEDP